MSLNPPTFGVLLPTTVVGSYPVISGHGLSSIIDPFRSAVKTAVEDQIRAGIDIISDGQVRGNMIEAFTSRIPGINGQNVIGKVQPAPASITRGDIKYALSKKSMVKGIITGPSTLAHGLHISTAMYRNREELALDLAAALSSEAKSLEKSGITMLQIDEPIFSTGIADLSAGKQAIDIITRNIQVPVCMHVCGSLSEIIDDLLKFPVSILDFEFSNNPSNLSLFDSGSLSGRMIGYGCVDSTRDEIETVSDIMTRIERGVEIFGPEAILLDPDCGMRMRTRDAAFHKLKNMVDAAKIVRKEFIQDT